MKKRGYITFLGFTVSAATAVSLLKAKSPIGVKSFPHLSEFVREIKFGFARHYSRRHNRRGYFGGDRFKSVIVDKGENLVSCLAYIDLHPVK
jgi:hypothetical protein